MPGTWGSKASSRSARTPPTARLGTNCRKYRRISRSGRDESTCRTIHLVTLFRLERVNMIPRFLHQALFMKAAHTALVAKLVVVIDDDPLILEATEGLLRSWGCCVVTAQSCDEALVRLAETEAGRRPDVIVCDYQLSDPPTLAAQSCLPRNL